MTNERVEDPAQYWKAKHREVLRDLDTQEGIWRELEKVLRRLVTRLCIAASGTDPRLDSELAQVASAIKRDATAAELQGLFDSLSKAIIVAPDANANNGVTLRTLIQPVLRGLKPKGAGDADKSVPPAAESQAAPLAAIAPSSAAAPVEAAAPPAAAAAGSETAAASATAAGSATPVASPAAPRAAIVVALTVLLQRLNPADSPNKNAESLLAELPRAASDGQLARVIERAADLVRERGDHLTRERLSAAALLTEVTSRLNDVAAFIASGDRDLHASREAGETLNSQVLLDVRQLSDEAKAATDLLPLRQLIAARVDSISTQVRAFREREDARYKSHTVRTSKLSQQVRDLKSKTVALESDLEQARQLARIDSLTGVANRAAFDERMHEEIARRQRSGTPVSLLYWDLDHFKAINDQFGHVVGDKVLREVAACFISRMRGSDFIARLGGEEFVTLLMDTPTSAALKVADDLREAVAALRMHCRGTPVPVTVSCGVTELHSGDTCEAAMERADAALYRAKDNGRNICIAA